MLATGRGNSIRRNSSENKETLIMVDLVRRKLKMKKLSKKNNL